MKMLRRRYDSDCPAVQLDGALAMVTGGYHWGDVDDDELMVRYSLPSSAVQELLECWGQAEDGAGDVIETLLTRKAFALDYSYGEFEDLGEPAPGMVLYHDNK